MTCKKCGSNVIDTAKFCPNCGENLQNLNNNQEIVNNTVVEKPIESVQVNNTVQPENVQVNQNPTMVQPNNTAVKKKSNNWIIWLVVGIIGAVILAGIVLIVTSKSFIDGFKEGISGNLSNNTIYYDGYSLEYPSTWTKDSITTQSGETKEVIYYGNKEAYLYSLGISALSSFENQYSIDFETESGKKKLYDEFYKYWDEDSSTSLFGGSDGFSVLKDDIYYASMNYGKSSTDLTGKLYLVVSKKYNIIISLMSNVPKNFNSNSSKVLDIIKTININKNYDEELYDALSSMTAWNKYSNKRQGLLGTNKDINGSWRVLGESDANYVFKDGEYWWYKSLYDVNDNYWYGTTKIYKGKEGFSKVGLSEDRIDYIKANSSGNVSEDDIYTIIFTPSKIISDGEDKSSTNITGEDWHMVWIIVDHGSEGLEAQILNVKTSEKVKD